MRYFLICLFLIFSHFTYGQELNLRCTPEGSLAAYQARVDYIKRQALAKGVDADTLQYLEPYSLEPDYEILKGLRESARCKSRTGEVPLKVRQNIRSDRYYWNRLIRDRLPMAIDFYKENQHLKPYAEKYGAPFPVVLGIMSLESNLCMPRSLGYHDVLHVLLTKAYFYVDDIGRGNGYVPMQEVIAALKLIQEGHVQDVNSFQGSYAGAYGCPQFLPSSVSTYAVDANKDGRIDLYNSLEDIVASVANYLSISGYKKEEPWCYPVEIGSKTRDLVRERVVNRDFYSGYSQNLELSPLAWQEENLGLTVPQELLSREGKFRFLMFYEGSKKGELTYSGCLVGGNLKAVWRYNNKVYGYAVPVHRIADALIRSVYPNGKPTQLN